MKRDVERNRTIEELLESACPSIKFRTRLEILNQSASSVEMLNLQQLILQDDAVKEVMNWQQPDGWLGQNFHGTQSLEAGIRLLCEKGVQNRHPVLAQALQALEKASGQLERGIGKVGNILDDLGFGGSQMIRAVVFAYAGEEKRPCVTEQVNEALTCFRAVLGINTIDELAERYRGKWIFRPNVKWPSIYHLRLLALCQQWRSPENRKTVTKGVQRLVDLSPIPDIHVRHKSQLIAPGSFAMHHFNPNLPSMNAAQWMMWFHRIEMLSRLGAVSLVPELAEQVTVLRRMLRDGGGCFIKRLSHYFFKQWGAYSGLMLEKDWRSPRRREYDLTFRSLLILHFIENRQP